jgi:hypothetical protein
MSVAIARMLVRRGSLRTQLRPESIAPVSHGQNYVADRHRSSELISAPGDLRLRPAAERPPFAAIAKPECRRRRGNDGTLRFMGRIVDQERICDLTRHNRTVA